MERLQRTLVRSLRRPLVRRYSGAARSLSASSPLPSPLYGGSVERTDRARSGDTLAQGGDRREFRRQAHGLVAAHSSSATSLARVSLRLRDIIVRDADGTVVASAPKAESGLSGLSLLSGTVRAKSPQSGRRRNGGAHREDGSVTVLPAPISARSQPRRRRFPYTARPRS